MWKYLIVPLILWTGVLMQACGPQFKKQTSCNFMQNVYGERISWKRDVPVVLDLHTSFPESAIAPLKAAMDTWEQAAGRRLFQIGNKGVSDISKPRQDGRSLVYWMSSWEAGRLDEQGRTVVYWIGDQIKEADLLINQSSQSNFKFYWSQEGQESGKVELESLFLHELGHVLGLKHNESGSSVMDPKLRRGQIRSDLAGEDVDSLFCEY